MISSILAILSRARYKTANCCFHLKISISHRTSLGLFLRYSTSMEWGTALGFKVSPKKWYNPFVHSTLQNFFQSIGAGSAFTRKTALHQRAFTHKSPQNQRAFTHKTHLHQRAFTHKNSRNVAQQTYLSNPK